MNRVLWSLLILIAAIAILGSSSCSETSNNSTSNTDQYANTGQPAPPVLKTITRMDQLEDGMTAIFQAPNGKSYVVESVPVDYPERELELGESDAAMSPNTCGQGEDFDGSDRFNAKVTADRAPVQSFPTLDAFMRTLPDDILMGKSHVPRISLAKTSVRAKEEKRNVHIDRAWIYTFLRQDDEDFHVIIGSTPDRSTAEFFNIEISALSPVGNPSRADLLKARTDFKTFFGTGDACPSKYGPAFQTPFEVEITGSAFFDKGHADRGQPIGPAFARPHSYWEIHPITKIVFK